MTPTPPQPPSIADHVFQRLRWNEVPVDRIFYGPDKQPYMKTTEGNSVDREGKLKLFKRKEMVFLLKTTEEILECLTSLNKDGSISPTLKDRNLESGPSDLKDMSGALPVEG
jgi:hypothetical protein